MSLTLPDLHIAVRALIAEGSDLATGLVIPGNDDGPRPQDPYASALYLRTVERGYPVFLQTDSGTVTTTQETSFYSVQWYRDGAVARAHNFVAWARSELGLEAQVQAQLRFQVPIRLSEPYATIGDSFEPRSQTDLAVNWISRLDQAVDIIDQITGTVEGTNISVTTEGRNG